MRGLCVLPLCVFPFFTNRSAWQVYRRLLLLYFIVICTTCQGRDLLPVIYCNINAGFFWARVKICMLKSGRGARRPVVPPLTETDIVLMMNASNEPIQIGSRGVAIWNVVKLSGSAHKNWLGDYLVDEDVLSPVVWGNKAPSLRYVEPFAFSPSKTETSFRTSLACTSAFGSCKNYHSYNNLINF